LKRVKWIERSRAQVLIGFLIWYGMLGIGYLWMPPSYVVELLCLVTLSVSSGVLYTFGPIAASALLNSDPDTSDLLALGAFLKSLALVILAGWIVGFRTIYGYTPALKESLVFVHVLSISTYGGVLYLVSEGALPGNIPRREWVKGGLWVVAGVFSFGVFVLLVT
jgi:hypothetical protein